MKENFFASLKEVLTEEGGYVDNPRDPGGATNKGVTQAEYDDWRHDNKLPKQSVRNISQLELGQLYKRCYWDTLRGDILPLGLDYCVFDFGVNSGVLRGVRTLQRCLGVVDDGQIGPATLAALAAFPVYDLIDAVCDARLKFLQQLKTFDEFGRGWTNRIHYVRERAKDMAE